MRYFKPSEFECKCGCKQNLMKETTLSLLEQAREYAAIPFTITSGYRCEKHNKVVGGVKDSAHVYGYAVDIKCLDNIVRYKIVNALLKAGFNRIGLAKTFIHADNDPSKPAGVIWEY